MASQNTAVPIGDQAKKSRKMASKNSKHLPMDVISYVFTFLSIREAIRAGAVATTFRDSWRNCRNLNFGKDFARGKQQQEYVEIVNKVFESHSGSKIRTLHLYLVPSGFEPIVVKWIQQAVKKGVEELELNFLSDRACYRLSLESLKIPTLRTLRLAYCGIEITPANEFCRLDTIIFRKVNLVPRVMDTIFQICTRLHTLDMTDCSGAPNLIISAMNLSRFEVLKIGDFKDLWGIKIFSPTLTTFYYRGKFVIFELDYIPRLTNALINLSNPRGVSKYHRIGTLVDYLKHVTVLTVSSAFVEELCSVRIAYGYNFAFRSLSELQVILNDARYCSLFDIACLVNNCPILQKLIIDLDGYLFDGSKNWTDRQKDMLSLNFRNKFPFLKDIKVKGFRFCQHELELVKYLLDRAEFLDNLIIVTPKNRNAVVSVPNAFNCHGLFMQWKPPLTRIVVCEPSNDSSGVDSTHVKTWYSNYSLFKEPYC